MFYYLILSCLFFCMSFLSSVFTFFVIWLFFLIFLWFCIYCLSWILAFFISMYLFIFSPSIDEQRRRGNYFSFDDSFEDSHRAITSSFFYKHSFTFAFFISFFIILSLYFIDFF